MRTPRGLAELYGDIVDTCGPRLAEAARVVCRPAALPALVFCSAGKDRTGILCAVVLSAVGVATDEIARDFARSADAVSGRFRAEVEARAVRAGITEQALAVGLGAPPDLVHELLAHLDSRGGAAAYLAEHGLTRAELEDLRSALVEPS